MPETTLKQQESKNIQMQIFERPQTRKISKQIDTPNSAMVTQLKNNIQEIVFRLTEMATVNF